MAADLINRYFWLMDVIYRSEGISREDINRKWSYSCLNERGEDELPERTFHRYRKAIERLFDVNIICVAGKYKIEDIKMMTSEKQWLLDSFAINNMSLSHYKMRSRISVEDVPSSRRFLMPILNAMEDGRKIEITYQSFYAPAATTFIVEPWGLKLHHQRWYMVGHSTAIDKTLVYGLDRIREFSLTDEQFEVPEDFDCDQWFGDVFGVNSYAPEFNLEPQDIEILVSCEQIDYILSKPLHRSQRLVGEDSTGYILSMRLVPSCDFIMELMKYGAEIEIVKPIELREIFIQNIEEMNKRYGLQTEYGSSCD